MAPTVANILVGAQSAFKLGAYVTAKGAGTLTDVGATVGGVTLHVKPSFHMVTIDQALGDVMAVPTKREAEIKVKLLESTVVNLQQVLAQPAANISGTAPNQELKIDLSAAELYYQSQLIGKGLGTTKTRTATNWRTYLKDLAAIPFKKDSAQELDATFGVLEETTGSGVDDIDLIES